MTWKQAAKFCEETFGIFVNWEERFFICPECDEVLLEEDWDEHNWESCPICESCFEEIE